MTTRLPAGALALALMLLAGCGGGGSDATTTMTPPVREPTTPEPDPEPVVERLPLPLPDVACDALCRVTGGEFIAEAHHGIYPEANAPADLQHALVYLSGPYLRVGVDQGRAVGSLSVTGIRGDVEVRHGRVADGVGRAMVRRYLEDAYGERYHGDPAIVRIVGAPSEEKINWVRAAVRAVNAALPVEARMRWGPPLPADYDSLDQDGVIAVKFVPAGSLGGSTAGRTPSRVSKDASGEITGAASVILLDQGANVLTPGDSGGERRAVILIAHELVHALGLGHVPPTLDTIMADNADMYRLRQGRQQPASLLYSVDREALRVLYEGHDPTDLGPWSAAATHLHGNGAHAGFGVALRNGYAEPYAYGRTPTTDLADNRGLSGSATWEGSLLGLTPGARAVAGDAEIGVNLGTLTGRADFTELEAWAPSAAPGDPGTGTMWLDGDLGYAIAVRGNTFRETGGDEGRLTGIFIGAAHEGAAGTLERSDLTAAFGATR